MEQLEVRIQGNQSRNMAASLKIPSLMIFLLGMLLIIPKIAEATGTLGALSMRATTDNAYENSRNSQEYQPPDFGGPDSQHGSGTR
jgi:hypothetical protein